MDNDIKEQFTTLYEKRRQGLSPKSLEQLATLETAIYSADNVDDLRLLAKSIAVDSLCAKDLVDYLEEYTHKMEDWFEVMKQLWQNSQGAT